MTCALEAIQASVAKSGAVAPIVPIDGEEWATLEAELCGICDRHSPVDRNGDCRFVGTDPDGSYWQVALLAVPRKPCSRSRDELYQEYHECFAKPSWPSLEAMTAAEIAFRNLVDSYIENPSSPLP